MACRRWLSRALLVWLLYGAAGLSVGLAAERPRTDATSGPPGGGTTGAGGGSAEGWQPADRAADIADITLPERRRLQWNGVYVQQSAEPYIVSHPPWSHTCWLLLHGKPGGLSAPPPDLQLNCLRSGLPRYSNQPINVTVVLGASYGPRLRNLTWVSRGVSLELAEATGSGEEDWSVAFSGVLHLRLLDSSVSDMLLSPDMPRVSVALSDAPLEDDPAQPYLVLRNATILRNTVIGAGAFGTCSRIDRNTGGCGAGLSLRVGHGLEVSVIWTSSTAYGNDARIGGGVIAVTSIKNGTTPILEDVGAEDVDTLVDDVRLFIGVHSTLSNNTAEAAGGAVFVNGRIWACHIDSSNLTGNMAILDPEVNQSFYPLDSTGVDAWLWDTMPPPEYYGIGGAGGAIFTRMADRIQIRNGSTLSYNQANSEGGAIFIHGESYDRIIRSMTIEITGNSHLSHNTAAGGEGGAIRIFGQYSTLTGFLLANGSSMSESYAVARGGALSIDGTIGTWAMADASRISGNRAEIGGGGIFTRSGISQAVLTSGSHVSYNEASRGDGGGVLTLGGLRKLFVTGGAGFWSNSAAKRGGAVAVFLKTQGTSSQGVNGFDIVAFQNGIIRNNSCFSSGGFMHSEEAGQLFQVLDKSTVTDNRAQIAGGVLAVWSSLSRNVEAELYLGSYGADVPWGLTIANSSVVCDNWADGDGGAFYILEGVVGVMIANSSRACSNRAGQQNGGFLSAGEVTSRLGGVVEDGMGITVTANSSVEGNYAEMYGGAFFVRSFMHYMFVVDHSRVYGNTAVLAGGALYVTTSMWGVSVANHSTLSGNEASKGTGGAIFVGGSMTSFLVESSSNVSLNSALESGGAISLATGPTRLEVMGHSSVAGNRAGERGGALSTKSGPDTLTLDASSTLASNAAGFQGGVVSSKGGMGSVTLLGTVSNNTADSDGGALSATQSIGELLLGPEARLLANAAGSGGSGGAVHAGNTIDNITVEPGCHITGNSAGAHGGVFWAQAIPSLNLSAGGVSITGNRAVAGNGGFACAANASAAMNGTAWTVSGVILANHSAGDDGGFFYVGTLPPTGTIEAASGRSNITLLLSNCTASDSHADGSGGLLAVSAAGATTGTVVVRLTNMAVTRSSAGFSGGVVAVYAGSTGGDVSIHLEDITADSTDAMSGDGGLLVVGFDGQGTLAAAAVLSVSLSNVTATRSTASGSGGLVAVQASNTDAAISVRLVGSTMTSTRAVDGGGGALSVRTSDVSGTVTLHVATCQIYNSSAFQDGGAVEQQALTGMSGGIAALGGTTVLRMVGCRVDGSAAEGDGGAVRVEITAPVTATSISRAAVTIEDVSFTNCSAGQRGGALAASGPVDVQVRGSSSRFRDTQAHLTGGAVAVWADSAPADLKRRRRRLSTDAPDAAFPTLKLSGVTFTQSRASDGGGGCVWVQGAALVLLESASFTATEAGGNGGAISVSDSAALVLSGCNVTGSWAAAGVGGAVSASSVDTVALLGCRISGNAALRGGGVDIDCPSSSDDSSRAVLVMGSSIGSNVAAKAKGDANRAPIYAGYGGGVFLGCAANTQLLVASSELFGNCGWLGAQLASLLAVPPANATSLTGSGQQQASALAFGGVDQVTSALTLTLHLVGPTAPLYVDCSSGGALGCASTTETNGSTALGAPQLCRLSSLPNSSSSGLLESAPTQALLSASAAVVKSGEELQLRLRLLDADGNPVSSVPDAMALSAQLYVVQLRPSEVTSLLAENASAGAMAAYANGPMACLSERSYAAAAGGTGGAAALPGGFPSRCTADTAVAFLSTSAGAAVAPQAVGEDGTVQWPDSVRVHGWPGEYSLVVLVGDSSPTAGRKIAPSVLPFTLRPCGAGELVDLGAGGSSLSGRAALNRLQLAVCSPCPLRQVGLAADPRPSLPLDPATWPRETSLEALLEDLGLSLVKAAAVCSGCPPDAACPGGGVVVPRSGFWHASPTSLALHPCLNAAACQAVDLSRVGHPLVGVAEGGKCQAFNSSSSNSSTSSSVAKRVVESLGICDARTAQLAECQHYMAADLYDISQGGNTTLTMFLANLNSSCGMGGLAANSNTSGGPALSSTSRRVLAADAVTVNATATSALAATAAVALARGAYLQLQCAQGYTGNLCAACEPGYSIDSEWACKRCSPTQSRNVGIGVIGFLINIIVILYTVFKNLQPPEEETLDGDEGERAQHYKSAVPFGSLLKVIVVHVQQFIIIARLNIDYPDMIGERWLGQAARRDAGQARIQFLAALLVPVAVILTCLLFWALWTALRKQFRSRAVAPEALAAESPAAGAKEEEDGMVGVEAASGGGVADKAAWGEPSSTAGGARPVSRHEDSHVDGMAPSVTAVHDTPLERLDGSAQAGGGLRSASVLADGDHSDHPFAPTTDPAVAITSFTAAAGGPRGASAPGLDIMAADGTADGPGRPASGQSGPLSGQSRPVSGQSRPVSGQARGPSGSEAVVDSRPPSRQWSLGGGAPASRQLTSQHTGGAPEAEAAKPPRASGDSRRSSGPGGSGSSMRGLGAPDGGSTRAAEAPEAPEAEAKPMGAGGDSRRSSGPGGGGSSMRGLRVPGAGSDGRSSRAGSGKPDGGSLPALSARWLTESRADSRRSTGPASGRLSNAGPLGEAVEAQHQLPHSSRSGSEKDLPPLPRDASRPTATAADPDGPPQHGTKSILFRRVRSAARRGASMIGTLKAADRELTLLEQLVVVVLVSVFVLYPALAQASLSAFSCYLIDVGGSEQASNSPDGYWSRNMQQACYQGVHARLYVPLGAVFTVVFGLVPPMAIVWIYWTVWRFPERRDEPRCQLLYGFMFAQYELPYAWYDAVVLLQTYAMVAVAVFAQVIRVAYQALLLLVVMLTFAAVTALCGPLRYDMLDHLQFLSFTTLCLTLTLSIYFLVGGAELVDSGTGTAIGALILALNAGMVASLLGVAVRASWRDSWSPGELWSRWRERRREAKLESDEREQPAGRGE
ncbi:hypothetical protein HYH03_010184 [Edaphochlamys debaryana]|uniref:Uncharacterized protein n=1 Tax=Edaphochlamys debaryana TaxID=47281 RepID=A0A835XYJ3_9CHLO|nr:hypothetical protein HYH03_010184 [Edaphochlamys debaryana]|eukprot:KAG2491393.1 hypothetical protein HYH03_010184 [Edaphochlamys debaryana]